MLSVRKGGGEAPDWPDWDNWQHSEEHARLAIEAANLGTWDYYPATGELKWSARMKELVGLAPTDPVDYDVFLRAIHPEDRERVQTQVARALNDPESGEYRVEYRVLSLADGTEHWHSVRGRVFFGEKGAPLHFIGIALEVTQQKRTEEELKRLAEDLARSNQDLSQLATILSHDLREPLRMVTSFLQLIAERRLVFSREGLEFLRFAQDGATRMKELIESLCRYCQIGRQRLQLSRIHSEKVLRSVLIGLQALMDETKATVTVTSLPWVQGDAALLGQVFQNLITNSIRFRGKVSPCIRIGAEALGKEWVFTVADNGIGFQKDAAERVFQIFQQLQGPDEFSGTGTGLALCRKILELHRGRIWAESEPGKGATFHFTLPRVEGPCS